MARKRREGKLAVPAPETFSDVPIKDWDLLRRRVAAAKGRVIVLVHPFFKETIIKERIEKLVRQSNAGCRSRGI